MDRHEDDNRWDFDCPQFVDFTLPMPFNDGADELFANTVIGESRVNSAVHSQIQEKIADAELKGTTENAKAEVKPNNVKPSNLVTSLEEWTSRGKHASATSTADSDEATNKKKSRSNVENTSQEASAVVAPKPALRRSNSVRSEKNSSVSSQSSGKSSVNNMSSGSRQLRSHVRTLSQGRSRSSSVYLDGEKEHTAENVTSGKPNIPNILKRLGEGPSASSSKVKSTEELELERIKQLRKELQHKRQMAQESFKKAMTKAGPMVVHSKKDPTMPQEFCFQTDKRLKTQTEKVEEEGLKDFVKSLRSRTVVSPVISGPKRPTVPQPFHLTEKHKTGVPQTSTESKFESLAEKVTAFHKKTPDRFRTCSREKPQKQGSRSNSPQHKLTQPHTPHLTAHTRHRPTHYLSQEQLEAKEVEEMKQNQFKARPVNVKILTNPNTGVRKVPSKPVTEPEEFALTSTTQKKKEEDTEEQFEFHAKPLNKKILEGPVGVKPVKPVLPTVPMSPAFALKHRVRLPVELPEEKADACEAIRAKPVPHTGIPFQPKLPHQHTVPEPFTVEERSRAMLAQKEEKIRQILEEEKRAREFHAQPLPDLEPARLPEKQLKEATKPEPFNLETDQRGTHYLQELAHKVGTGQLSAEEEEQRKAAQFRAQPNRVIYKDPFIPAKSSKALTVVSDFELNSDRRAVQREEFEMHKKEREAELEGHRRQREQREKEEEEAFIAKLRTEMVHHPNPVRRYNPVVVRPSDKPLTEAESPRFSDRLRAKVRL